MKTTSKTLHGLVLAAMLAAMPATSHADCTDREDTSASGRPTLTGLELIRDGFHFQVAFGIGGGPDSLGIFHAMEIGGTFENGWTLALLHTFIQNDGVLGNQPGPDLFGGWMPEVKIPLFYDDLLFKFGIGLGGIHDQSNGITAYFGLGWFYGIDFDIPIFRRSGFTFGAQIIEVYVLGEHHIGGSFALGYTFF